jgi:hypothetical protein
MVYDMWTCENVPTIYVWFPWPAQPGYIDPKAVTVDLRRGAFYFARACLLSMIQLEMSPYA